MSTEFVTQQPLPPGSDTETLHWFVVVAIAGALVIVDIFAVGKIILDKCPRLKSHCKRGASVDLLLSGVGVVACKGGGRCPVREPATS